MKALIWILSILIGSLLISLLKPNPLISTIIAVIVITIPAFITHNITKK